MLKMQSNSQPISLLKFVFGIVYAWMIVSATSVQADTHFINEQASVDNTINSDTCVQLLSQQINKLHSALHDTERVLVNLPSIFVSSLPVFAAPLSAYLASCFIFISLNWAVYLSYLHYQATLPH